MQSSVPSGVVRSPWRSSRSSLSQFPGPCSANKAARAVLYLAAAAKHLSSTCRILSTDRVFGACPRTLRLRNPIIDKRARCRERTFSRASSHCARRSLSSIPTSFEWHPCSRWFGGSSDGSHNFCLSTSTLGRVASGICRRDSSSNSVIRAAEGMYDDWSSRKCLSWRWSRRRRCCIILSCCDVSDCFCASQSTRRLKADLVMY